MNFFLLEWGWWLISEGEIYYGTRPQAQTYYSTHSRRIQTTATCDPVAQGTLRKGSTCQDFAFGL